MLEVIARLEYRTGFLLGLGGLEVFVRNVGSRRLMFQRRGSGLFEISDRPTGESQISRVYSFSAYRRTLRN